MQHLPSQKQRNNLMRVVKPATLIDRNAVERYISLYGTPVCFCCNTITFLPVFRLESVLWRVFCLNCGTTRDTCGTCMHQDFEDMSIRMVNPAETINKLLDK
jgi:hypothetical protein